MILISPLHNLICFLNRVDRHPPAISVRSEAVLKQPLKRLENVSKQPCRDKLQGYRNKLQGDRNKLKGDRNKLQGARNKLQGDRNKQQGDRNKLQC